MVKSEEPPVAVIVVLPAEERTSKVPVVAVRSNPPAPTTARLPATVDHVAAAAEVKVKAPAEVVKLEAEAASQEIPVPAPT